MLTLTRKIDESIVIGEGADQIEITVKEIRRNQVRIGISARADVKIYRKELYIKNMEAAAKKERRENS
ncbi:MAG: carbon storage regulator [Bradymonadales bacterium]|jgi:carbon storage regulator